MKTKIIRNWIVPTGQQPTEMDKKILHYQNSGCLVPKRRLILNDEQIEGIRRSSAVNTGVLDEVAKHIKAGMSTEEIDQIVYKYTTDHGAIPADLNYEGYPKSVCTSVNEVVCHGIPNPDEILQEGDIVNVDVSTILDGYYSDASRMFIIGKTTPEKERLVKVAKECLEIGAAAAQPYGFVGDIGNAIANHAHKNGYSVVEEFCGHGVGLKVHEDPEIPNYVSRFSPNPRIREGMVIAIEPMINLGGDGIIDMPDGWTVVTADGKPAAHWEHTVAITANGPEVLTQL